MELKALGVPLAASLQELEEVDALLVDDTQIIQEALHEHQEWSKVNSGNR